MRTLIRTLFFLLLVTQMSFAQWVQVGLSGESIKDIAVQNSTIFALSSDTCITWHQEFCLGKVSRSVDNGANWTMIVDSNAIDLALSPTNKVFMTKADSVWWDIQLYFSLDNGDSWINANIFEQLDSLGGILRNIALSPTGIAYCGLLFFQPPYDLAGYFAKSTDDGLTWTFPGWIKGGQIFGFNYESVITIGEGFREISMSLSSDNGNSWNYLEEPPAFYNRALSLFSNGNIIVGDGDQ